MRITIPAHTLSAALARVAPAVARNTTKPVLECVKLVANADLAIIANDLEITISTVIAGDSVSIAKPGECLVSYERLAKILKTCDGEVEISGGDSGVVVKNNTSRFDLAGFPVDEFPDAGITSDAENYHEATAGVIEQLIERTVFAADKKDSGARFALTGIKWEVDSAGLVRLIATDSKRLSVAESPATITGDVPNVKADFLLPAKALALLRANLLADADVIRISLSPNAATFSGPGFVIYTRLVEGRYPPWRDIISQAKKSDSPFPVPAPLFLAKLRQASITADADSCRVDMEFRRKESDCVMKARGAASGASEVVMALPGHERDLSVAFDPTYLTEFLKVIGDGEVMVSAASGDKPVIFASGEGWKYLVMPLVG